jgi:hypothetical protein
MRVFASKARYGPTPLRSGLRWAARDLAYVSAATRWMQPIVDVPARAVMFLGG